MEKILQTTHYSLPTTNFAVVGLGFLIGKPIATWLMGKAKEIILLDKFSDLSIVKNADVIILGTGQAGLIKPEMLKDGAGVIDFGYTVAQAPPRTNADGAQTNADIKMVISGDFDTTLPTTNYSLLTVLL